jgi:hypothetical protein
MHVVIELKAVKATKEVLAPQMDLRSRRCAASLWPLISRTRLSTQQ